MLEEVLDFIAANQNLWGFLGLFGAAMIEYVLPMFPGDTVLLLGGVLVAARGWSPLFVLSAATLGSLVGSVLDYYVGKWVRDNPESGFSLFLRRRGLDKAVNKLVDRFKRHGTVYIAINRFLPGIRAFFFVAAGLAGTPLRSVVLWGTLSALVWNIAILVAGYMLGGNLDALQQLFTQYTTVVWVIIAVIILVWVAKSWWSRRNKPPAKLSDIEDLETLDNGEEKPP